MCEIVYNILITNFTVYRCIIRSNAPSNLQMQPLGCIFVYALNCITFGTAIDPACGSGGMFIQSGDFVNAAGMNANSTMTFYGQEKVEYNAQLCLMNMAVHGLTGVIKSGDEANSFYHDAHNLDGCCDYVMANPPFNVDKVKAE